MPADAAQRFHGSVTALAVAWLMLALAILVCLQRRVFPGGLKYFSTVADACFLTGVLSVADGPRSPLVVGYFLVIVLATLRFSLHLIWLSTGLSLAGYLFLLGYARWYRPEIAIPRYHQLIFVLGLGLTGIMLGQVIRRVRVMATEYAARRQGHGQSPAE